MSHRHTALLQVAAVVTAARLHTGHLVFVWLHCMASVLLRCPLSLSLSLPGTVAQRTTQLDSVSDTFHDETTLCGSAAPCPSISRAFNKMLKTNILVIYLFAFSFSPAYALCRYA